MVKSWYDACDAKHLLKNTVRGGMNLEGSMTSVPAAAGRLSRIRNLQGKEVENHVARGGDNLCHGALGAGVAGMFCGAAADGVVKRS